MKDKIKKVLHVKKRETIPDLSAPGCVVSIKRRYTEKEKTNLESWSFRHQGKIRSFTEEKQRRVSRRKKRRYKLLGLVVCIFAVIVCCLVMNLQTYTKIEVLSQEKGPVLGKNHYIRFGEDILCYNKDTTIMLDMKGKELWKEGYQIQNPVMEVNKEAAVLIDRGGNDFMIFDKNGMKGRVHTALPIEKVSISEKGITAVLLKDKNMPNILCYDAEGKLLIEYKVSTAISGYPLDLALSPDGTMLMVSYLKIQNGEINTEVSYYDFGKKRETEEEYKISSKTYKDVIVPDVFFVSNEKSAAVGTQGFMIYEGDRPEEEKNIKISTEIKSVCYDENYLAIVVKKSEKAGYRLWIYDYNGKKVLAEDFQGEYDKIKIDDEQIIMYSANKCSIYNKNGVHRFEGSMGTNIDNIFPAAEFNRYMIANDKGIQTVRLTK